MTYPAGNPGFQPAQPPGSFPGQTPSFTRPEDTASKLPLYLYISVVVFGLAAYLFNFGPILVPTEGDFGGLRGGAGDAVTASVLAALLAGAGMLPKANKHTGIVAAIAALGALLAINVSFTRNSDYLTVGWALWVVLGLAILQAGAAILALLLEAGVVTAPAPRPKFDPYSQYGLPHGASYYGQPGGHSPGHIHAPQPGYPSYGSYPPAPTAGNFSGPPSGGFSTQSPSSGGFGTGPQQGQSQGPPTPPTGFPSFPPPPGSTTGGQNSTMSDPTQTASNDHGSSGSSAAPSAQT